MIEGSTSRRMAVVRRITGVCGIISQLVGVTALLVVVSSSPWFNWTENHISVFGVEGSAKALFNGGLILVGMFSLIFAIGLGRCLLSGRLGQLAVISLVLGSIAVIDMGLFPRTWDFMHGVSTVAFFVGATLALLYYRYGGDSCFADGSGITEYRCCRPHGCPPAGSRAVERWCYATGAGLLAVVVVDNSPWGYADDESQLFGV